MQDAPVAAQFVVVLVERYGEDHRDGAQHLHNDVAADAVVGIRDVEKEQQCNDQQHTEKHRVKETPRYLHFDIESQNTGKQRQQKTE